ncbi:Putative monooxygenase [Psilocybe cubensis]|uniref:Monooxygenase n=2 Tax=Psilocybe cubensis TaxID=181762 RepID=A0ACB8GVG4_PSICU|nr:Putative monooxygenase [Psilocybe cubensis]KAH9479216.1 Putative monooxygenase [Psilocybe cubensis]
MAVITTPITELFGIKHPILLAGMNVAAGPELAAAVTNAGGLGVIGGIGYTPKILRQQIQLLKKDLKNPNAPFGVDLLLPQVGGSARKTNTDYTKGQLPELIQVIIEEKATLFVSAVGVPPAWAVQELHKAGILVMNMVGHPKHVKKALDVGVDLICAQAGEGGGHTGDIAASILIPACVDAVKGAKSPLTGKDVYVVGAGAVFDGRGLAANLAWGAQAVWVGTRFVASVEAGAPKLHKELVVSAGFEDVARTVIFTGRPMRVRKTPYVADWEENRQAEIKELTSKGIIPHYNELEKHPEKSVAGRPWLMGSVSSVIKDILPAQVIVDNMVRDAAAILQRNAGLVKVGPKL